MTRCHSRLVAGVAVFTKNEALKRAIAASDAVMSKAFYAQLRSLDA